MSAHAAVPWTPGDLLILPARGLCLVSHIDPSGDVWIRVAGRVLEPWERWTVAELAAAWRSRAGAPAGAA